MAEEATTLEAIPGPAGAAIGKAASGGKITILKTITPKGATHSEAAITSEDSFSGGRPQSGDRDSVSAEGDFFS